MKLENCHVSKFRTSWEGGAKIIARYSVTSDDSYLERGKMVRLEDSGKFACTACRREVKKLFDSYCYPCFKNKAEADLCIVSPHRCHYLAGTCREPQWAETFCYQPHVVYLSFTDKFKVGITRINQIPTRWT